MSDEEWRQEILESFQQSGLVPAVLTSVPNGLVNVNFGTHDCVHMGTNIEADIAAYEPSKVSWPAQKDKLYTLVSILYKKQYLLSLHTYMKPYLFVIEVMFDVDNNNYVHWLEVNLPDEKFDGGDTIVEYSSPTPPKGQGEHRQD